MFQVDEDDRALVLTRRMAASRAAVFRAWREPALVRRWWAPPPFTTPVCEVDLRPGGVLRAIMHGPGGGEYAYQGVFLEVVADEVIVFTDAYVDAWTPSAKPFMTVMIALADDADGGVLYTARVSHWSREDRERHEQMGFYDGWGTCVAQLEATAAAL